MDGNIELCSLAVVTSLVLSAYFARNYGDDGNVQTQRCSYGVLHVWFE